MNISSFRPPKHENVDLDEGKDIFKFNEDGEMTEHLTVDDTPQA